MYFCACRPQEQVNHFKIVIITGDTRVDPQDCNNKIQGGLGLGVCNNFIVVTAVGVF